MRKEPVVTGTPANEKSHWPSKEARQPLGLYVDPLDGKAYTVNMVRQFVPLGGSGSFDPNNYTGKGISVATDLPVDPDVLSGDVKRIEDVINHVFVSGQDGEEDTKGEHTPDDLILESTPVMFDPIAIRYIAAASGMEWDIEVEYYNVDGWTIAEGTPVELIHAPGATNVSAWRVDPEDTTRLFGRFDCRGGNYHQEVPLTFGTVINKPGEGPIFSDGGFKSSPAVVTFPQMEIAYIGTSFCGRFAYIASPRLHPNYDASMGTLTDSEGTVFSLTELSPADKTGSPADVQGEQRHYVMLDIRPLADGEVNVTLGISPNNNNAMGYPDGVVGKFTKVTPTEKDVSLAVGSRDRLGVMGDVFVLTTDLPEGTEVMLMHRHGSDEPDDDALFLIHSPLIERPLTVGADGKLPPQRIVLPTDTKVNPSANTLLEFTLGHDDGTVSSLTVDISDQGAPDSTSIATFGDYGGQNGIQYYIGGAVDLVAIERVVSPTHPTMVFTPHDYGSPTDPSGESGTPHYAFTTTSTIVANHGMGVRLRATYKLASGLTLEYEHDIGNTTMERLGIPPQGEV